MPASHRFLRRSIFSVNFFIISTFILEKYCNSSESSICFFQKADKKRWKLLRVSHLKKFWLVLVFIFCVAAVVGGNIYWNHKLNRIAKANSALIGTGYVSAGDTSAANGISAKKVRAQIVKLPQSMQKVALKALDNNGQVQVVMIGSENVQALSLLLQHQLDGTFGNLFFKVTADDLGKSTSLQLNQGKVEDLFQSVNGSPDVVIYTPLLYNDDGKVSTDDTNTVTALLEEKIKLKYPQAAFFVSLPDYSSTAQYMNDRIDQLSTFIKSQHIANLDYLPNWPTGSKQAGVVAADGHTMNKAGQQIWLKAISHDLGLSK